MTVTAEQRSVAEHAGAGEVGDFYARLRYPGPDAIITRVWANRLEPHLPSTRFRFLDAGCGSGRHSAGLLLAYPESTGVGIDISAPSLAEARALIDAKNLAGRMTLTQASFAEPLPYGAEFDVALACGTIHHSPDPAASLRHIAAVVKPGGLLAGMVYGARGHRRRYEIKEMLEMLAGGDLALRRRLYASYRRHAESWLDRTPRQMMRQARGSVSRWRHRLLGRAADIGYETDPARSEVLFLDAFASPIDSAFDSPTLRAMLDGAGLDLVHMFTLGRAEPALFPEDWRARWRALDEWQRVRLSELIDPAPASFSFIARKSETRP